MHNREIRHVAVLGGGPAGLYTARLLKLARPQWSVEVHEQFHPKDTFGFGVGLSASTQRNLAQSDPDTLTEIVRRSHSGHGARLHTNRGDVRLDGQETLAIARSLLLQILYDHAESSGVVMHIGHPRDHHEIEADVVVAADGGGSPTRHALATELGATVDHGRQRYLWCGTDFALPDALFAPVTTEYGVFTTHAYPYASDRSTFLVESDEKTWRAAGLEAASMGVSPDESDTVAIEYLQEIFAEHLDGHRLLGNRSRWNRFRTVRCKRWYAGNVVLVGDAAHTAHYSVGSGTKLAMEDAIALTEALTSSTISNPTELAAAFGSYQANRNPAVEHLQRLADRSQLWWEAYPRRLEFSPQRLAVSFISRAGNVSLDAFTQSAGVIAVPALAEFGITEPPADGTTVERILAQPLRRRGQTFSSRVQAAASLEGVETLRTDIADTWGAEADEFVARCAALLDADATGIRLVGPPSREAVLHRLDLAERLRLDLADRDPLTVVDAPAELRSDLAAGLVAARVDLISLQDGTGQ